MPVRRSWPNRVRRAGAAGALAALPVAAAGALAWTADGLLGAVRGPGPASVDQLVALAAAAACGVTLATVALGAALTVLASLLRHLGSRSGRGGCRRAAHSRSLGWFNGGTDGLAWIAGSVTPALVRRLAAVALGMSLAGATAGPAGAASAASHPRQHVAAAMAAADAAVDADADAMLAPGWSLDRPVAPRRASTSRPEGIVVVRRGDTLWGIAARALGGHATAREVAAAWPGWHHANRRTIGADPDLLMPGQRLRPPALDRSPSRATSPGPATREEGQ